MRPLRSLTGISKILLRLALIAVVYALSFHVFLTFSFNSVSYFAHTLLVLFAVLLLIGAFSRGQNLTVVSALFMVILFVVLFFQSSWTVGNIIEFVTYISLAMYFLSHGNK
jgi:hypothetical protein